MFVERGNVRQVLRSVLCTGDIIHPIPLPLRHAPAHNDPTSDVSCDEVIDKLCLVEASPVPLSRSWLCPNYPVSELAVVSRSLHFCSLVSPCSRISISNQFETSPDLPVFSGSLKGSVQLI